MGSSFFGQNMLNTVTKNVKTWYNFMEQFILYSKEMNDEKRSEPADLADGIPDCL